MPPHLTWDVLDHPFQKESRELHSSSVRDFQVGKQHPSTFPLRDRACRSFQKSFSDSSLRLDDGNMHRFA